MCMMLNIISMGNTCHKMCISLLNKGFSTARLIWIWVNWADIMGTESPTTVFQIKSQLPYTLKVTLLIWNFSREFSNKTKVFLWKRKVLTITTITDCTSAGRGTRVLASPTWDSRVGVHFVGLLKDLLNGTRRYPVTRESILVGTRVLKGWSPSSSRLYYI